MTCRCDCRSIASIARIFEMDDGWSISISVRPHKMQTILKPLTGTGAKNLCHTGQVDIDYLRRCDYSWLHCIRSLWLGQNCRIRLYEHKQLFKLLLAPFKYTEKTISFTADGNNTSREINIKSSHSIIDTLRKHSLFVIMILSQGTQKFWRKV